MIQRQSERQEIHVSTRELTTQQQLNMLLGVLGMTTTAMGIARQPLPEEVAKHPMAGEAAIAAENTFIKCCAALDSILDDRERWDMSFHKKVEKMVDEQAAKNIEFVEAQVATLKNAMAPHNTFRVKLSKLRTGDWAVWFGDSIEEAGAIIGIGRTPEEACESFDQQFKGEQSEHVKKWMEKFGNETDNEKKLDTDGTDPTGNSENPGQDNRGDSEDSGPESESGSGS